MGKKIGRPLGRPKLDERAFEVSKRIKDRRIQLGMRAHEIALILNIPCSRYLPWEKQFGPTVERKYRSRLAAALQVSEDWLSFGTEPTADSGGASKPVTPDSHSLNCRPPKISEGDRIVLGTRVRHRRESMRLARKDVAKACDIPSAFLGLLERAIPVRESPVESALEKVLCVPEGWIRNAAMNTPSLGVNDLKVTVELGCSTVAEEIRAIGAWLCRAPIPLRTTEHENLSISEKRIVDMFASRYGIYGEDNSKLQSIGDRLSITRERVRQAVTKLTERSDRLIAVTPMLDRLSTEIKPHLPATPDDIDQKFRWLLGENLSVLSVARFAREVLGRSIVSSTAHASGLAAPSVLVLIDPTSHEPDMARAVRDASLRMIRSCGGAQIHMVTGMATAILRRGVTIEEVERAIRVLDGFEWINEEDGWFWLGHEKDSRVWPVVRKVLSVAQQVVDITDIAGALSRSRRNNYGSVQNRPVMLEAPPHILTEILRRIPWLENVQSDDFRLKEACDPLLYLSDTERVIYQNLAKKGNTASRWAIHRDVIESNLAKHVVIHVCLDSSPIFSRISRGVFSLRGRSLVPAAVSIACGEVGGEAAQKRLQNPGIADDLGSYHLSIFLTEYMVAHSYYEVPAAYGNILAIGDYYVAGLSNPVAYAVTPSGSRRLHGLIRILVDRGYKAGDEVSISINVMTMEIGIPDRGSIGNDQNYRKAPLDELHNESL